MELILMEDVYNLGRAGEVVKVKAGYGRNYLVPQKKAIMADRGNLKNLEHRQKVIERNITAKRDGFQDLATKLAGVEVNIAKKIGGEEKIFGSVTASDIAEALKAKGIEVEKKFITIIKPIKKLGSHDVEIRFANDIIPSIKVNIVSE